MSAAASPTEAVSTQDGAWWSDHANLADLYEWLVEHDRLDPSDARAVTYFLRRPWKWSPEWLERLRAQ